MEKQQIESINARHISSVDKLYRMHGGLSSFLVDYRNQTIHLLINITKKWTKSPKETAHQLAKSWKEANPELAGVLNFDVIITDNGEESHILGKI